MISETKVGTRGLRLPASTSRIFSILESACSRFRNIAKDSIASAAFFFLSKRLRDKSVGRSLPQCISTRLNVTQREAFTHLVTCTTSGSWKSTVVASYAARLIPGYTTVGVAPIDGKCDLNTRAVNLELAKMTSACPVELLSDRIYRRNEMYTHVS